MLVFGVGSGLAGLAGVIALMAVAAGGFSMTSVRLLGGAGGKIKGGRVLDHRNDPNRKMCSLFLSLLDKADIHLDSFGDSTQPLSSI